MVIQATGGGPNSIVGAINEWNPKSNRTITDLYAFGNVTGSANHGTPNHSGEPFEIVPGNVSGMQIDARRWDLYQDRFESVFGTSDTGMLSDHLDAFNCKERWTAPITGQGYIREYLGCWFQDTGRGYDAKGDRTVNASGTIRFTRRQIISI